MLRIFIVCPVLLNTASHRCYFPYKIFKFSSQLPLTTLKKNNPTKQKEPTWNASTFPSLYWTWLSTTSLVSRRTSRHRWKAFPKRDFFLSWIRQNIQNLCNNVIEEWNNSSLMSLYNNRAAEALWPLFLHWLHNDLQVNSAVVYYSTWIDTLVVRVFTGFRLKL